jgi:hypothetical protein
MDILMKRTFFGRIAGSRANGAGPTYQNAIPYIWEASSSGRLKGQIDY